MTANSAPELLDEVIIGELDCLGGTLLSNLALLYLEEAAGQVTALSDAIASGDLRTVRQRAHKFIGSSGTLGATRVRNILVELETRARGGDLGDVDELLARLRLALTDTRRALTSRLDRTPSME